MKQTLMHCGEIGESGIVCLSRSGSSCIHIVRHYVLGAIRTFILAVLLIAVPFTTPAYSQGQQKSSSIVIHDTTKASNGGEKATEGLRNQIESNLAGDKPCVETLDDQDLRDAMQDERERELLEGGDSNAALKAIGDRFNSRIVMSVQAMPGPGGSVVYSSFAMDTQTGQTLARKMGGEKEVADGMVHDLSSYLADTCKPHWTGTIKYVSLFNETKTKDDKGAMHTNRRNVKRTTTETSTMETIITASLLPPASGGAGKSTNSPVAHVVQKTKFEFLKSSSTSGEQLCRERGQNPYFKGFSEESSETTTQIGRGTDKMPVYISVDNDGSYTIKVVAPSGVLLGKVETRANHASCGESNPPPTIDAQDMPEGKLQSTSFDAEGKVSPKNKNALSGSQTLPDGHTKITWNLRLVKPKGN
jgi:hypothetical protein